MSFLAQNIYNVTNSAAHGHKQVGAGGWCMSVVSNFPYRWVKRRLLKKVSAFIPPPPDQKAHLLIFSSSHRGTVRRTKSKKELSSFTFCWPFLTAREAVNDFLCSAGLYWCSRKMTRECANIFTAPESGGGLSDTEEDNGGRVNGYRGGCRGPL